jgi:hypothetical protein
MPSCNYVTSINSTDCISTSVPTINNNFNSLQTGVNEAADLLNQLNSQFGTFSPGLTSLDQSILYFARITEAYNPLTTTTLTIPSYVFDRILNTIDYNCDNNGNRIQGPGANNGFYKIDTNTGIVTVPPGVYDIDAEASLMGCEAHVANLVYVDSNTGTPADVLFHGSAEYTEQAWVLWAPTWSKMRGRAIFTQTTRIKIRHYSANGAGSDPGLDEAGVRRGRTFADDGVTTDTSNFFGTPPLSYYAFLNIQKIKNV